MKSKLLIILTAVILFLIPGAILGQTAPTLGTTSSFALFTAGGAFTVTGASVVTGDVGNHVGANSAFPPGTLNGTRHWIDGLATTAATDVDAAYTQMSGMGGTVIGVGLGVGQILNHGVYQNGAASTLNGNLTLDAQGDPNALFIIRIGGAFATGAGSTVTLINSASACNVYWQIGGQFDLGTGSVFIGTVIVDGAINLLGNSSLLGRGLSRAGAISLAANVVTVPFVGTPVFTMGATSTRCQAVGSVAYTATATNTTGITYTLDAASITGGNSIVAGTGAVTYVAGWSGTTIITASAAGCSNGPTSATHTVTVNPALAASVSIAAVPAGAICAGTSVTFTASPVNSGVPTYQWKKGGVDILGATNSTYTSLTLVNADAITVVMTSTAACVTGSPATSNTVNMIVNSAVAASVSIAAVPAGAICAGTSVTFTSSPVNGGVPTYQWKKGGVDILGATNSTYTSVTLANADAITVIMTSTAACVTGSPATSNTVNMVVNPAVAASVSIAAVPAGAICAGTSVTFTASPVNGGVPTYQWKKGGVNILGATNSTYTSVTLANADAITVIMTSTAACVTGSPATSNTVNMIVNALPATSAITGNNTPLCSAVGVLYNVTATAGSSYAWTVPAGATITAGAAGPNNNQITVTFGTANGNIAVTETTAVSCVGSTKTLAISLTGCGLNASFTGTPLSVCLGSMVTFTNTSTGTSGATTYSWNFGAGASPATASTIGPIAVTYSTGGSKTITLTITDGTTSTATQTNYITVNPPPAAPGIGLITQPTCVLSTGSVALTGLPALGTWTVTESVGSTTITGTGTTATFSGLSANNYTFSVTDAAGCTSVASGNAVVNAQPPTPVVSNQIISISTGGTFTVTPAGVPGGTTYTWTAPIYTGGVTGGSAQAIPQPNISGTLTIPSGTGTATYTVTPTSGSCVGVPFTVIVTVDFACVPVSIGTQPVNSSMCSTSGSASFTVSAVGSAPFTYQWQYNNSGVWGNVINGIPTGAVYSNQTSTTLGINGITLSGSYQYRSYLTNCIGANNATSNIATLIVNATPSAPLAGLITQPTCAVAMGSVILSGLPAGNWTINPGAITGSTASTTISGLTAGTYNFTVTDAVGCISSASANVVITASLGTPGAPTALITQPTCLSGTGSVVLSGLPAGNWTINPGAIIGSTASTTISGLVPGTYNYTVTNSSGCISLASANIVINAQPGTPSILLVGLITQPICILPTGSVVLSGLPAGNWTINPGAITGSTASTTITGLVAGTYNFTVTNAAGCISLASANVVITAQAVPAAPTVVLIQPDCAIPFGTITVLAPTGVGMTYSINGTDYTNTTGVFTMVPTGTYTVTAKNSDGCISSK